MSDTPHNPGHAEDLDDLDRLFLGRLDRAAVPAELTARVLASTVARTDARSAALASRWVLAALTAVALLSLVGYQIGAALASSDGVDLIAAVADDLGLLVTAPGEVVLALGEVMPWGLVLIAGLSATVLTISAGQVMEQAFGRLRARPLA